MFEIVNLKFQFDRLYINAKINANLEPQQPKKNENL